PASPLRPELILEEGLTQARVGDPAARKTLGGYLRQYPGEGRVSEARLALAELALLTPGEGVKAAEASKEAGQYLSLVKDSAPSPELAAHTDYLAIWLADSQENRSD